MEEGTGWMVTRDRNGIDTFTNGIQAVASCTIRGPYRRCHVCGVVAKSGYHPHNSERPFICRACAGFASTQSL